MGARERTEEEEEEEEEEERKEQVWSWGAGTEGQLCTGKLQDEHLPHLIPSLPPISHLSCGGAHVIALTPGGRVLTWGRGTSGQLGHDDMVNSLQPKTVEFLDSIVINYVSAGWNHSGFVSDDGCLFTCGDGSFGQLGHGDYKSHCRPSRVIFFSSSHVKQIACGMRHSLALLKGSCGDQVYGFGSGKRGQLGISEDKIKSISLPQISCGLEDVNIATVRANGDHSAALSVDGHLYTWGRGFKGSSDLCCPHGAIGSLSCKKAVLGWNHALILTGKGEVHMLGGSHHGVLGNPSETSLVKHRPTKEEGSNDASFVRVPGLDGTRVVDIAAGAEHSALVSEEGEIMTWGWGEHGQLGLGNTVDQTCPQVVSLDLPEGSKELATSSLNLPEGSKELATSKVYAGSGFTFVVRTKMPPSS